MNEIYLGNDPGSPPESICDKCEKCLAGECDRKPCAPHPDWCDEFLDANGEHIASCFGIPTEADAALIVAAVNERERLRDIVRRLVDSLQGIMDAAEGRGEGVLDEALLREARAAVGEARHG